ncbi:MAG: DUF1440 domain-containing protein [Blastocatellia bacterium]
MTVTKGLLAGSVGGLAASWVMNVFQKGLSKIFEGDQKPHGAQSLQQGSPGHGVAAELRDRGVDDPDDNAAERTANFAAVSILDRGLSESEKHTAGGVVHYVFGISTGAVYGAASELFPDVAKGFGLPFGASVWLLADEITVPALGLSKSAKDYPISKHVYALASHLVYGVATDLTRRMVKRVL